MHRRTLDTLCAKSRLACEARCVARRGSILDVLRAAFGLAVALAIVAPPGDALELHVVVDSSRVEYHITHTISDVTDRAGTVTGRVEVDSAGVLQSGLVEVDLRELRTGIQSRDHHIHSAEYLDVEHYPTARFTATDLRPDSTDAANKNALRARGTLELHGQTRDIEVPLVVERTDDTLRARGQFTITLADYGIKRPKKLMFAAGKTVDVRVRLLFSP